MQAGVDHGNSASALVARVKAGKPLYAWDDPCDMYNNNREHQPTDGSDAAAPNAAQEVMISDQVNLFKPFRHHHHHRQPSFYDREALGEKMKAIQDDRVCLIEKELGLSERLEQAEAMLTAMRDQKRRLATAKMLDDVAKRKTTGRANSNYYRQDVESCGFKEKIRDWDDRGDNADERAQQREELANFAVKDRILELELLNDQLRRGQAKAESETRSHEAAARATKSEVLRVTQRLQAMPKRFTESLQALRDEVEVLHKEKLSLELAKQQRKFKEADLLAEAKIKQTHAKAELDSTLDEIDEIEDDHAHWKRLLRVEATRADSLQSRRNEALEKLTARFGEDAVERAAFASAACREACRMQDGGREGPGETWNGSGGDNSRGTRSSVPLSKVAEALRPAYAPDGETMLLTTEAVLEAARECGVVPRGGDGEGGGYVDVDGLCAVVQRLKRKKGGACD